MRSLTLCLITFVSVSCRDRYSEYRCWSTIQHRRLGLKRMYHYIQGGAVRATCTGPLLGKQPYLTINGKNVTDRVAGIYSDSDRVWYETILNRSTKLGEYRVNAANRSLLMFLIGYILCDPTQVAPEKVCGKGQFCVINGSSTRCQQQLDCESITSKFGECENGKVLRNSNSSCSGYNNATNIPHGYYFGSLYEGTECSTEPRVFYKGHVVEFLATVPVSDSRDLEWNAWNGTSSNMKCAIVNESTNHDDILNLTSNSDITWPEILPARMPILCILEDELGKGATEFSILFYEKNRLQFSIVQMNSDITINITNNTDEVTLLKPSVSFSCIAFIDGGLFVKAFSTEKDENKKPHLRNDTIQMEYNNTPNAIYTCTAEVYYYEFFPPDLDRFKLLYNESRQWSVRVTTTRSTTTMQAYTSGKTTVAPKETEYSNVALIAVCVVFSLVVTGLIIVIFRVNVLLHQAKAENKELAERTVQPGLHETDEMPTMRDEVDEEGASIGAPAAESKN